VKEIVFAAKETGHGPPAGGFFLLGNLSRRYSPAVLKEQIAVSQRSCVRFVAPLSEIHV
jgi:hypothetical protein